MPNRILREGINSSLRVDALTPEGEVFYRRLMSAVDDFGRHEAHPDLLLSKLYPLKIRKIKPGRVEAWLAETEEAGLVRVYTVEEKQFLEICDFRQQIRSAKSKCPSPAEQTRSKCVADDAHPISDAHLDGDGDGDGDDVCTEPGVPDSVPTKQIQVTSDVLLSFPVVPTQKWESDRWELRQDKVDEWQEVFTHLDVAGECRFALQWIVDNPEKRKTGGGMTRFLNAWLARSQNKGGGTRNGEQKRFGHAAAEREAANADAFAVLGAAIAAARSSQGILGPEQPAATTVCIEESGTVHTVRSGDVGGNAECLPY